MKSTVVSRYGYNKISEPEIMNPVCLNIVCEQALLFGRVKGVSRKRASERRSRKGQGKGPSLARSREAHLAFPNGRACSQASLNSDQRALDSRTRPTTSKRFDFKVFLPTILKK